MAFQTGSQVRPELGRADLSGFARAGESIGAALASVGKSVGEGFEKYQENKEVTTASLAALEAISVSRPDAYAELRNSDKKIGNILRNIEDGNYKRNDLQSAIGALQTSIAAKDARRASELQDLQLRAVQSEQQQQEINQNAFDMAFMASREAETGKVDTTALSAAYFDQGGRDPNDLKIIESMQEVKGPNLKSIKVGPFTVLTQDGAFKQGFRDGEEATPSQQRVIEFKLEERKRARELYQGGNTQEANDILAVNGYEDAFGRPQTAEQAFGPLKTDPNDANNDSSSLDDVVLGDEPPKNNVATPEEVQAFNNQFLITNPQ